MPAPTFIASYGSVYNSNTTPKTVSVTTQPGDIVVVYAGSENGGNAFSGLPSGNGITFTQNQSIHIDNTWADAAIWSGTDTTGGTSWTLSLSRTSTAVWWGFTCLVFRNSAGIGASSQAQSGSSSGDSSISLTTTQANSAVIVFGADWNTGSGNTRTWKTVNGITPSNGNGLETTFINNANFLAYGAYYNDTGTAGSKTYGFDTGILSKTSLVALEIKAGAAAASAIYRNTAEGQTNGTTVTAANSGGGSGQAFGVVSASGTITRTFSTSYFMHGTRSYALTPSGSASITFVFDGQNDMSGAQQAYFFFTGYPSANCAFMGTYSVDTKSTMAVTTNGAIVIYDDAGSIAQSADGVVPLNRWVRFDMITSIGTTTSNGRIQAKVSLEDNSDTLYTYDSGSVVNVGTTAIESYLYGKLDSTPTLAAFYMDDTAFKTTATSYIAPVNDQLRRNTAEGQPDGTTLTNLNSGGGSGDAFDTVTVSGTVARTFSNEQKMFGAQSYKIAASATSALYNRVNTADVYSGSAQLYLYLPTYADANQLFVNLRNASASIASFNVNQAGTIYISNSAGSNIHISSVGIFPTNQWIRIDLAAIVGTTTANGRIVAQASLLNSFAPFWTYDSGYTTNTGTTSFAEFRFGKLDTAPNIALFYMDDASWRPKLVDFIPGQSSSPGVAWFVA